MSQDWYTNVYQATGKSADTIMGQIELMLEALRSGFCGTSYPGDPTPGMACFRTDTSRFYMRNAANTAWVLIFDLGTSRAPDADKCSPISVTAGTGLSGGGALSASRTLSHAAHTGDVTGAAALTIANNAVNAAKAVRGMVNLPFHMGEQETALFTSSTSWALLAKGRVYIPSGVANIYGTLRISRTPDGGGNQNQFYFKINGVSSGTVGTTSSTYTYYATSANIAGTSGYQDIEIYSKSLDTSPARAGYLQGFAFHID